MLSSADGLFLRKPCEPRRRTFVSIIREFKLTIMEKENNPVYSKTDKTKVNIADEEWKKILSPQVYHVARQKGTERPWTSEFEHSNEIGTYYCAVCGNPLFKSDTKFESGCGWPSFYEPISKESIIYTPDNSHGMHRTEVECGRCKSHLGHVFEDGPPAHRLALLYQWSGTGF